MRRKSVIKSTILAAVLCTAAFLASPLAYGSQAVYQGKCTLTGEVVSVTKRVAEYADPNWAKSWGIKKAPEYTDVVVRIVNSALTEGQDTTAYNNCTKASPYTYQLLDDEPAPAVGACITALRVQTHSLNPEA